MKAALAWLVTIAFMISSMMFMFTLLVSHVHSWTFTTLMTVMGICMFVIFLGTSLGVTLINKAEGL